ncbi:PRSS12 [Acanthosepion pharaonis]|uniref:PRSS12 n=1 Tax=Acanthosepion pharaonis TaxID=158019 RepID=A0A812CCL6_ACAPH|nr:PRSS12 [Sepia pharaonis]
MKKRFCLLLLAILGSLILSGAENPVKKLPDANSAGFKEAIIYEPLGNDRIRLTGDSDYYNHGLVKVFRNNSWGYVCDDDWDINDANVACRQLGFNRGASRFFSASWYREAKDGLYLMDDVKCAGDEKQLQKCSYNIDHDCDKNEAAGVICNLNTGCEDQWIAGPAGCYRLFNGTMSRYDAENKCKSLNGHLVKIETQEENNFLSSILRTWKEKHYWLTDGIKEKNWIWKTDGKPISSSFWFPGWEPQSQFPNPSNNTLKRCLALANAFKYKDSKYLSEYFYWDNIKCNNVSNFICETEKTKTPSAAEYNMKCSNNEMSCGSSNTCVPLVWECDGEEDCPGGEDESNCVASKCSKDQMFCTFQTSCIPLTWKCDGEIDCQEGEDESNCNLRKCLQDQIPCANSDSCISLSWKCDGDNDCSEGEDETNCDSSKCLPDQMTCASSGSCISLSWKCNGIKDCPGGEDETNCGIKVELVGGFSELNGRIEITRNGIKGTVCDDEFDNNDATVICRMLGHSSGEIIPNIFGYGEGTIWLDNLNCTGSEYDLEVCPNLSWGTHNCTHKNDVAIKCFKELNTTLLTTTSIPPASSTEPTGIKVELVGGSSELSGRIEITRNGIKGTVCDDEFDNNDATVICRMLGHSSGEIIPNIFGYGEGTIWLDNLNCTGSEYDLEVCPNLSWGKHDCTYKEDVAIKCFKEATTTLSSTTSIPPTSSTDQNVTCGRRPINQRYQQSFGGQVAKYGAFPWQARILEDISFGKLHHCGAAIINKFWLLTAAHCLKKIMKKESLLLQTGDLNSKIWDTHEQSFQAEHLITHPLYNSLTHDYDIGLIKLRPESNGNGIVFNDYVQPVCLPPQNLSISAGTLCEISGWSSTGEIYPSMLKAARIPLLHRHLCATIDKGITPRMFCAGYIKGGIDICKGDIGEPLVCSINGVHTLIGITSYGKVCIRLNNPRVYTDVAQLKPWIMATLAKYS